jgi:hypothetical protein
VDERTVTFRGSVFPHAAFDSGGLEEMVKDVGIPDVAATIPIEVVHPPVVVLIDEDVGRGSPRVPAVRDVAEGAVVDGRPKPAHDGERARVISRGLNSVEEVFQFLEQTLVQDDVLRITAGLLAEKLLQLKMR